MSTLTVTPTYANGSILYESDLDAVKSTIETYYNTTKIEGTNIQTNILTGSTKIDNSAITTAKIQASAVTTAKLEDSTSTTTGVTTAKLLDSNVTTAKIADSAVTAAKIADLAVTASKINGIPKSVYPAVQTAYNTLTDLTVSTNTTTLVGSVTASSLTSGKWVLVSLESSTTSSGSGYIELYGRSDDFASEPIDPCLGLVGLYKDGVLVYQSYIRAQFAAAGSGSTIRIPLSSITYLDTASASSHTYSLYIEPVGVALFQIRSISIKSAILKTMQLV